MLRREEGRDVSELEILDRLIAFDTVSRTSNLELIGYVRDYLAGLGVAATVLPNEDGSKASLFATIGPDRPPPPAERPFRRGARGRADLDAPALPSDAENGRVYGRGTTDMKGFVACALALVPRLAAGDLALPVHLAVSHDEEIGCFGAHAIASHLREIGLRPLAAFVGEPTGMAVVTGHKGSCGLLTEVQGLSATRRGRTRASTRSSTPSIWWRSCAARAEALEAALTRLPVRRPTPRSASASSRAAPHATPSRATAASSGTSARRGRA